MTSLDKRDDIAGKDLAVDLALMAVFAGQGKTASDPPLTWLKGAAFNPFIRQILLDLHQDTLDGSSLQPIVR